MASYKGKGYATTTTDCFKTNHRVYHTVQIFYLMPHRRTPVIWNSLLANILLCNGECIVLRNI